MPYYYSGGIEIGKIAMIQRYLNYLPDKYEFHNTIIHVVLSLLTDTLDNEVILEEDQEIVDLHIHQ